MDALLDETLFPPIIGGNIHAAVVMIAERAADMIRGRPAPAPATLDEPEAATAH